MKTYTPKLNELVKKWYLVDLKGKTMGHVSVRIANLLRGKDKPSFTPHLDCGDYVVVINAKHLRFTGNKLEDKKYYRHSGYPSGLKEESLEDLLERRPEEVIKRSVAGMIPKNKLKKEILAKLKIFPESEHKHEAQNPELIEI
jgi:large subunit ribosomal protein L13